MNRKKQIQEIAKNIANRSITNKGIAYLQAIEAMELADRTMIARVCDWLENYAELTGIDSEVIKESFLKAMEE